MTDQQDDPAPRKLSKTECGRLGGLQTKARHSIEHFRRAGKLGFAAAARNHAAGNRKYSDPPCEDYLRDAHGQIQRIWATRRCKSTNGGCLSITNQMYIKLWFGSMVLSGLAIAIPHASAQDWDRTPEGRPLAVTPNTRQRERIDQELAPMYRKLRIARHNNAVARSRLLSDAREHQRQYARSLEILRQNQPSQSGFLGATPSEVARWNRAYNQTMAWHRASVQAFSQREQALDEVESALDKMAGDLGRARSRLLRGDFDSSDQ